MRYERACKKMIEHRAAVFARQYDTQKSTNSSWLLTWTSIFLFGCLIGFGVAWIVEMKYNFNHIRQKDKKALNSKLIHK